MILDFLAWLIMGVLLLGVLYVIYESDAVKILCMAATLIAAVVWAAERLFV